MIRTFESLLAECEDVQVIHDNRNGRLYVAVNGTTIAMRRNLNGIHVWDVVAKGALEPTWIRVDAVFGREGGA
jgi:hypothetical protein